MYLKRFGLKEEPFRLTPDPRFFYRGKQHERALAELLYGVEQRKGFMVLTGEVGTGKTTVCRALLGALGPEYETALILNPRLTADELIGTVVRDFGVRDLPAGATKGELIAHLNRFLLTVALDGRGAVLLVDESQELSGDLLEELRLLSNLETDREKLLQIVLIGQPELVETLSTMELRQLRQRVAVWAHLGPLDPEETASYIGRRLAVASGGHHVVHFTPKARKALNRLSGGYPRTINLIADRALLGAFSRNTARVNSSMVVKAGREVAGRKTVSVRGRQTAAVVVAAAAIAMVSFPSGLGHLTRVFGPEVSNGVVTERPAAVGAIPDLLSRYFILTGSDYLGREARLWRINGRTIQDIALALHGIEAREQYGMSMAVVSLDEDLWRLTGAVGIVPVEKTGGFGLIRPDGNAAGMWRIIVPGEGEQHLVDGVEGGGPPGMTKALVLFRPVPGLRLALRRGDRGPAVSVLQTALVSLGMLARDQAIGTFGPRTEKAIATLQKRWGLQATGVLDDVTGYYLSRFDGRGWRRQT
ncbi:putative peptidoglycan binding domain protein [bacterium BMS3Abin14]|nr:putative peptidoglycan binding domain protein [bacterium BMS3Abin14]